ncbi:hypothetical protein ABEB36_015866 [Hypothenemus hampei]|uniref:Uncharacterized protein n=1 Tax=Hypothenemus hampei TaxID=57062 RepID=A0ABD1DYJ3_HYPHA
MFYMSNSNCFAATDSGVSEPPDPAVWAAVKRAPTDGEQRRDSTRSLDKTANPNVGRQSCIEAGPFVPPHRGGETAKEDLERFHSINSDANENSEDLQNITLISSEEEEIEQGNKRLRDETSPLAQTKKKPKGEETSNKISRMDTTVQQMCKQIDLLDKIVQGSHRPKQRTKDSNKHTYQYSSSTP